MLHDLYVFLKNLPIDRKKHLTAKFILSITFAAILISMIFRFRLINSIINMINVKDLTVIAFFGAGLLPGTPAQKFFLQVDTLNETKLPAQWDLQSCIDYALEQNITIRKNRVTAASTQIDVKTAKAALFPASPSLPASRL